MKRAPIVEDWSRFNRAVLEVADGLPQLVDRKHPLPSQPKRAPAEHISEPSDDGDHYGLITRHKWRKLA